MINWKQRNKNSRDLNVVSIAQSSYDNRLCREAESELAATVRAALAADDIPTLARRQFQPVAVRLLLEDLKPYGKAFVDLLEGGPLLPLRVMRGLALARTHKTYTAPQTIRALRKATGRTAEIIRGILTGEGHPSAVKLRRLAEVIRTVPLPIFELDEDGARDPDEFVRRSEATKRGAKARKLAIGGGQQ